MILLLIQVSERHFDIYRSDTVGCKSSFLVSNHIIYQYIIVVIIIRPI